MNRNKALFMIAAIAAMAAAAFGQSITVTAPNGGEHWMLGDPVTITWTATGASGDVRLLLMRSGGALVGTIANAVPVEAGSYRWESAGALVGATAAPGDNYLVRVRLSSEVMDSSNAPFSLAGRLPNIHIGSMREIGHEHTFLPPTFTAGDTVTIQYHLLNDSDYAAGAFNVGLRVGGAIVARNAYAGLENGDEASGEFSWTAVCGQPVAVVADCDGAVVENNEGDNVMTDPGLVCSQPDLAFFRALSCSGSDTSRLSANMNYQFTASIRSAAARADNVRVIGGVVGGAVVYDHTFPTIAGDGGTEDVEFVWQVPVGTSRVYVEIDPDNTVAESNERNNRQELAVTGVVIDTAAEHYDLQLKITQPAVLRVAGKNITAKLGVPMTVAGEVRGATGAIRDFKVSAWVRSKTVPATKIYEQDFNDPGMLVVPFSFSWTPAAAGLCSIQVKVELGPYATGRGVVDAAPGNNSVTFKVDVTALTPILKKR